MKKKLLITTLTLTSLLLIGGCGQSKTVETTATVEETAEVTEAEVTPTPEPTVEPTPEPTPTPVVELADDEVIPASLEAWNNVKHYMCNEISDTDVYQIAYDREKDTVGVIQENYKSCYCNGMIYTNNGTEQLYGLCDDGKYFNLHDLFSDEICDLYVYPLNVNLNGTEESTSSNFKFGADKYYVVHDWTSDIANPNDYYLIECYNTDSVDLGIVFYTAYYINKATLLPEYSTFIAHQNYLDEDTGESKTIVKDEEGNVIEYTGDPTLTSVYEFIYFDDKAAQTGDDYDTYVYMTTLPTDDQVLTGDDLAAYVTAYEEANPDLFTEAE